MLRYIYKGLTICLLAILLLTFTAIPVFAFEGREGDSVTIASGEVIDDDLYIAGNSITIDGTVKGDVWAVGNEVIVNGEINGNLLALAGTITVNGEVAQAVRIAGGTLDIRGNVGSDLLAFGGTLRISSAAKVSNDLVVGAGQADIAAPVSGDVIGGGGKITLSNAVGGNVEITADNLILLPTASIQGNLVYTSENEADIRAGAQIGGATTHKLPPEIEKPEADRGIGGKIIGFLMTLVMGIIIVLLAPKRVQAITQAIRTRPWPSLGWGAVLLFVTPIAALIVSITVIGLPIGLIALVLYAIAIYLAQLFIGLLIGQLIINRFKGVVKNRGTLIGALALGLAILTLLKLIPFVGFFIGLVVVLLGLGAILVSERQLRAEGIRYRRRK